MENQYRPFQESDIIEEGDQVKVNSGKWVDFLPMCFRQIINPDLVYKSRKLIKFSDDTISLNSKETWTRDEVIELCRLAWGQGSLTRVGYIESKKSPIFNNFIEAVL